MANNLTNQVRSISEVTKAVASGDLSKTVDVDVQGEMLDLKNTVNTMVGQLSSLANEVIRMSIEVGTEGKLGGQAVVADVEGMWKVCFPPPLLFFSSSLGEWMLTRTVRAWWDRS